MSNDSRLVMNQGPQPGQTFMIDKDLVTLGRDPSSELVINDPQASRQHARITRRGNLEVIEDLGSTNGTFVNGVRLTDPHTLTNGDVIGLGDSIRLTYYGSGASMMAPTEVLGEPTAPLRPSYTPPPPQPAPPAYTPPPPAYTPPPPPSAPPVYASPPVEEKKKSKLWIGCGCLVLVLICVALVIFLWYAPESFWLTLQNWGIPIPTMPF